MSITSPRRRLKFGIVLGAVVALSALAVPTAASAAEACVPGVTVSAATQPWLVFSQSPNKYLDIEAAYEVFIPEILALFGTVDATFTQTQLDDLTTAFGTAFTTAGDSSQAAGMEIEAQKATLDAALLAIDPNSAPATQAIFDGMNDQIEASQYGDPLNTTFNASLAAMTAYLTSIQDAITAATPVPTVTTATTDPINALAAGIDGFGAFAGGIVYGGAAAQVDRTCPAALADTGLGDPTPLLGGGALLLVLGAAALVAVKRREGVEA